MKNTTRFFNIKYLFLFVGIICTFFLTACTEYVPEKGDPGQDGKDGVNGKDGKNGEKGAPGLDGKKPEIKVDEDGLWWRLEGDTEWKLLMNIEDLAGHSEKYTVTFKSDGEVFETINDVVYKSTIETPIPYKKGYTFMGWEYNDKTEFKEDDKITSSIELNAIWGSTVRAVQVSLPENEETYGIKKEIEATLYNTYGEYKGHEIVFNSANNVNYNWTNIGLVKTYLPDIYEVVAIGDGDTVKNANPDVVVLYHSNCTSTFLQAATEVAQNKDSFYGKMVFVTNIPAEEVSTECAINFKFFTTSLSEFEVEYENRALKPGEKITLPTLEVAGFAGWSCDGGATIVTGEITPDGNVTYLPVIQ